eukprot:GHVR01085625.1.p1 GENE.GHVR01085625.1~~GHVR01085625.1.p1  ORF type:complete len:216 (+),score=53.60 GHVR01085625.1:526-1173(+)
MKVKSSYCRFQLRKRGVEVVSVPVCDRLDESGLREFVWMDADTVGYDFKSDNKTRYDVKMRQHILIPSDIRWEACECFFRGSVSHDPIQDLIIKCLEKVSIDCRRLLIQNILLTGGGAMLRGFKQRLTCELQSSLLRHREYNKLAAVGSVAAPVFSPLLLVFVGGAVYSTLEGVQEYTKDDFSNGVSIPDWASCRHTSASDDSVCVCISGYIYLL